MFIYYRMLILFYLFIVTCLFNFFVSCLLFIYLFIFTHLFSFVSCLHIYLFSLIYLFNFFASCLLALFIYCWSAIFYLSIYPSIYVPSLYVKIVSLWDYIQIRIISGSHISHTDTRIQAVIKAFTNTNSALFITLIM